MLKRPRDAFDTPDSSSPPLPASKRRFLTSSSPAGPSGSSPGTIRTTPLSTPYTLPYFRSPFALSVPHDSPSNPFGLNRALRALTLPRPTGFSNHIVLRMQIVSTATSARRRRLSSRRVLPPELPYRIVQVPLNYSFRLLHMLLLFLFASDARLRVRRPRGAAAGTARKDTGASSSSSTSKNAQESAESEGHLFEVFENIKLYANKYRPGVIKAGTGTLYARLSSTRERKLFPDEIAVDDENVFVTGDIDDDEGWVWEAEDDYLLSNVWSEGPDLKKGIIYHHTATTSIHITANQSRVPPRKGIGNTPHVFAAHGGTAGAVRMANVAPSPPASSSAPPSKANVSAPKRRRKRDPDGSSHSSHSDSGSASGSGSGWSSSSSSSSSARKRKRAEEPPPINDGEEVPDLRPHEDASEEQLERWNAHRAFERFLKREAARERAMRRVSDPKPSSRTNAREGGRETRISIAPSSRRARAMQSDGMSSPLRPRPHGTHVYGRRYEYAGRERDVLVPDHDDPMGGTDADADPDALPPSSPSTLPIVFSSDCDVWTDDTDGEPGYASGSGKDGGQAGEDEDEDEDAAENRRYMIELPLQTPFPAHPALRRRVRRASEKIERQVSRGLSEMSDGEDEGEAEAEGREDGREEEDGERSESDGKERVKAEDKENARDAREYDEDGRPERRPSRRPAAVDYPPPIKAEPVPISSLHSQPTSKRPRPGAAILSALAPPTPSSASERSGDSEGGRRGAGGSADDDSGSDGTGSAGSVEVDGFSISSVSSSAAPWLSMRGPQDGSGDDGGGWDSEEEI